MSPEASPPPAMGKRVLLRGAREELQVALDTCLVRCDVTGVREGDHEVEIVFAEVPDLAVDGVLTAALATLASVTVLPSDVPEITGLEADEAVLVGDHILVRPPWVERPAGFDLEDSVELVVPRGGAFGSGEHGSTQAALLALEMAWPREGVASFCDVGTGSGVLALYGATRGAREVSGCDLEAASVAAAMELVPAGRFLVGGSDVLLATLGSHADVVVANLTAAEHELCLADAVRLWTGVGPLVLSGMRDGEEVARIVALMHRLCAELRGHAVTEFGGGIGREGFVAKAFEAVATRSSP